MIKKSEIQSVIQSLISSAVVRTVLTLGLSVGLTAGAAEKKETKTESHKVTGGLQWTGYGVGKSHTGDLKIKSGTLELKGEDIVGGEFVMDMTTIAEKSDRLVTHLKSEDFFDVAKPGNETAKYVISKVEKIAGAVTGESTHKIYGNLTVKGKTNPLDFNAIVAKDGAKWKATGEAEIKDRTKYNIKYHSSQFEAASKLADKLIKDNIKVKVDVVTE